VKTSIRLMLTALAIGGVTWATAGATTTTPQADAPPAASLAFHDR
jgi:hypothetical protein